jgi:hypothetical protein
MGYLQAYQHDIFVSYAHSDLLKDWSGLLIEEIRRFVSGGLGLRKNDEVDVWWDYKISGNQPLTDHLRSKVARSGLLLVLMSDWYLKSGWCRDELEWFVDTTRQAGARRPMFVVRVRATDHQMWPRAFKDERGHPLLGYDFVRVDAKSLGQPKGFPQPADSPDSKEFYEAVRCLAGDIVDQLKALKKDERVRPTPARPHKRPELDDEGSEFVHTSAETVFLAAAPAEDVDDERDEVAEHLRRHGCKVVPQTNPLDLDEVWRLAPDWVSSCNKFVQILGDRYGKWKHDDAGLVMYQHALAKRHKKPIYVYRKVECSQAAHYQAFLEPFERDETGGLEDFVLKVIKRNSIGDPLSSQRVYMMAGPRDERLEQEVRQIMKRLGTSVYPFSYSSETAREISSILDENGFLDVLKRCGAIVLLAGNAKQSRDLWLERTILYIEHDIRQKLGNIPPYAVIDAPPPPPLEAPNSISVLLKDSPSFEDELRDWLASLAARPSAIVGGGLGGSPN